MIPAPKQNSYAKPQKLKHERKKVKRAVLQEMVVSGDKEIKHKRRKVKHAVLKFDMVESSDKNVKRLKIVSGAGGAGLQLDGASPLQALVSMTMSSANLANLIDPLTDPKYQDQDGRFEKIFATPSD